MTELLTIREAAARVGRSEGFVRRLAADGLIVARKIRGRWYVSRTSLDAWLDGWQTEPSRRPVVTPPMRWRG